MKKHYLLFGLLAVLTLSCVDTSNEKYALKSSEEGGYSFEYVDGDPLKARIYTLDNGLKVYLSVYKDAPRVQFLLPVRAGGAYDPEENTGLAHYLEHMMFKGSDEFGTLDWEKEKPLLDSIENMFNHYATLKDDQKRKDYYKLIDQVSNEAAKYAIPNEYDKMISSIGGTGLNAGTSYDLTVYMVNVPSNHLDKFLKLEGARYRKIVNRLFHTELEAVYEEKNRGLDSDGRKAREAMMAGLFKNHPYGTQTVIGTIDHLKNPSITEITKYFNDYYIPNNVAICMSGDLDPTATIQMIEKYFGDWKQKPVQVHTYEPESEITSPIVKEVFGPESESVQFAFRFGGVGTEDYYKAQLADMLLSNSEAGLIDLNLNQQQKLLSGGSRFNSMKDYSIHSFVGRPKEGQSLEEIRDMLLEQIELLKQGEFDDWLIDAVITDLKQSQMIHFEENWSRAFDMAESFIVGQDWLNHVEELEILSGITKEDIVQFVNANYSDNYVIVYKRQGEDPNKQNVEKPAITKVPLNRDTKSEYLTAWSSIESPGLEPVFVDYDKDIVRSTTRSGIPVLMKRNDENELFELNYLLDVGSNNDPKMKVAVEYLEFLGTTSYSAEELKKEFYKIGCSFDVYAASDRTYVTLSGLNENMDQALELFESLLNDAQPDDEALAKLVDRLLKGRQDAKTRKRTILRSGLRNYAEYGSNSPFTNVLSNNDLSELDPNELVIIIKGITDMEHRVLYYGPKEVDDLVASLNKYHDVPNDLNPLPPLIKFEQQPTDDPKVYWTHYDMVQTEMIYLSKGKTYDVSIVPESKMFNEYFGGGMNSVVFQEIREAQGLAYAVYSNYRQASKADQSNYVFAYIGTQSDKQAEAMKAMFEIMNNMPESESAFEIAKESILNKIESERITKSSVLFDYEDAKRLNLDHDIRKDIYETVKNMTMEDLKAFHSRYIKDKEYVTVMIGNRDRIDFDDLKQYGEIKELSLEEIFGYEDINPVNVEVQQ